MVLICLEKTSPHHLVYCGMMAVQFCKFQPLSLIHKLFVGISTESVQKKMDNDENMHQRLQFFQMKLVIKVVDRK